MGPGVRRDDTEFVARIFRLNFFNASADMISGF
jgi:hypothetical protein